MSHHPHVPSKLLIGTDLGTANPKLNNVAKGWRHASHEWVIMADSNLMLPPDYVRCVLDRFDASTGVVCAPPVGSRPQTFWAEVECAFLNTFQARWQYAVDSVGYGFAQGKTMAWRKSELDAAGGIAELAAELAEDAAATKLVRSWEKQVRLTNSSFDQPLGHRSLKQVVGRQLRWAQLRKMSFPLHYGLEVLAGMLPPLLILVVIASTLAIDPIPLAIAHVVTWYAVEAALALRAGWHWSMASIPASIIRDLMLPIIWISAMFQQRYEWRGNTIEARSPA